MYVYLIIFICLNWPLNFVFGDWAFKLSVHSRFKSLVVCFKHCLLNYVNFCAANPNFYLYIVKVLLIW